MKTKYRPGPKNTTPEKIAKEPLVETPREIEALTRDFGRKYIDRYYSWGSHHTDDPAHVGSYPMHYEGTLETEYMLATSKLLAYTNPSELVAFLEIEVLPYNIAFKRYVSSKKADLRPFVDEVALPFLCDHVCRDTLLSLPYEWKDSARATGQRETAIVEFIESIHKVVSRYKSEWCSNPIDSRPQIEAQTLRHGYGFLVWMYALRAEWNKYQQTLDEYQTVVDCNSREMFAKIAEKILRTDAKNTNDLPDLRGVLRVLHDALKTPSNNYYYNRYDGNPIFLSFEDGDLDVWRKWRGPAPSTRMLELYRHMLYSDDLLVRQNAAEVFAQLEWGRSPQSHPDFAKMVPQLRQALEARLVPEEDAATRQAAAQALAASYLGRNTLDKKMLKRILGPACADSKRKKETLILASRIAKLLEDMERYDSRTVVMDKFIQEIPQITDLTSSSDEQVQVGVKAALEQAVRGESRLTRFRQILKWMINDLGGKKGTTMDDGDVERLMHGTDLGEITFNFKR